MFALVFVCKYRVALVLFVRKERNTVLTIFSHCNIYIIIVKRWMHAYFLKGKFVWAFIVPLENYFTHMETSPLPMKSCKFWPMLGTHGNWATSEGSLACHAYCNTRNPFIMHGHLRRPVTLTPIAARWAVESSPPVFTT